MTENNDIRISEYSPDSMYDRKQETVRELENIPIPERDFRSPGSLAIFVLSFVSLVKDFVYSFATRCRVWDTGNAAMQCVLDCDSRVYSSYRRLFIFWGNLKIRRYALH